MEISLQQARMVERDLDARIQESLQRYRLQLSGRAVTTNDSIASLLKPSTRIGDEVEALRALIGLRYSIRQRIGEANETKGLNRLMTDLARIDSELHVIDVLSCGRRALDADKQAALVRFLDTDTATPIQTSVDTLLTEAALADLDTLKMDLTRTRRRKAAAASALNINEAITLSDAEVALLTSVKISP